MFFICYVSNFSVSFLSKNKRLYYYYQISQKAISCKPLNAQSCLRHYSQKKRQLYHFYSVSSAVVRIRPSALFLCKYIQTTKKKKLLSPDSIGNKNYFAAVILVYYVDFITQTTKFPLIILQQIKDVADTIKKNDKIIFSSSTNF